MPLVHIILKEQYAVHIAMGGATKYEEGSKNGGEQGSRQPASVTMTRIAAKLLYFTIHVTVTEVRG